MSETGFSLEVFGVPKARNVHKGIVQSFHRLSIDNTVPFVCTYLQPKHIGEVKLKCDTRETLLRMQVLDTGNSDISAKGTFSIKALPSDT